MIKALTDASNVERDAVLETTVCIVGGGVTGLTLAAELGSNEIPVLLVESGGTEETQETQDLSAGKNLGLSYFPLIRPQKRRVGGVSHQWCINLPGGTKGSRLRPLDTIDFERRPEIPDSGWPISRADLDPFYDRASSILGFDSPDYSFSSHFPGAHEECLAQSGFQKIVYKFLGRRDFLNGATRRVNEQSTVSTLVNGTILELIPDPSGQAIQRARCRAINGPEFTIKAQVFILANGGIQAPRLLLSSRSVHPDGIGNDHDLVGRYFMEHLHFWSGVWIPNQDEIAGFKPFTGISTSPTGMPLIGKLAPTPDTLREHGLLNLNYQLIEMPMHDAVWHPNLVWDEAIDDFRERHPFENRYRSARRRVAHWLGASRKRAFRIATMTEQSPNSESRVTLSKDRDAHGQRRADLTWRISRSDFESFSRTLLRFKHEIESAGLGKVIVENPAGEIPPDLHGGDHLMGTTRMHGSPRKGVVDANLKVHGIDNLYIAGPSVFTTAGYANPIYTLTALAIRLGDHLSRCSASTATNRLSRKIAELI